MRLVLLLAISLSCFSAEKTAVFAGGCFWCMQPSFDEAKGVTKTLVGYSGGKEKNPTYKQVSYGRTSHQEVIKVWYDDSKTSYKNLLKIFWKQINPIQANGQFADIGDHYKTVIFYQNKDQKKLAEKSIKYIEDKKFFKDKKVATLVKPETEFYPAEDYHQKYYTKNYAHYSRYKKGSGREKFLKDHWTNIKLDF